MALVAATARASTSGPRPEHPPVTAAGIGATSTTPAGTGAAPGPSPTEPTTLVPSADGDGATGAGGGEALAAAGAAASGPAAPIPAVSTTTTTPPPPEADFVGYLEAPDDVSASYPLSSPGGTVTVTATLEENVAVTVTLQCGSLRQGAQGGSGTQVTLDAPAGSCSAQLALADPSSAQGAVSYRLSVTWATG
jgi:hypothetical protein